MVASIGLFSLTLGYVWRIRHQPVRTGAAAMLGQPAEVLDWAGEEGHVLAFGSVGRHGLRTSDAGEHVEVTAIDGLVLTVGARPNRQPAQEDSHDLRLSWPTWSSRWLILGFLVLGNARPEGV